MHDFLDSLRTISVDNSDYVDKSKGDNMVVYDDNEEEDKVTK